MSASHTIHLYIGNALPHGSAAESADILALWQEIQSFFQKHVFSATCGGRAEPRTCHITLDAGVLLALMQQALDNTGSFDAWRQSHARDVNNTLAASLLLEISSEENLSSEVEAYEIATIFLQQLVIAANLVRPGACRLLQTAFHGEGGHRYEAQPYDSKLYYGAFRNMLDLGWWNRHNPVFGKVWQWLEKSAGSHACTAIESLDKVLFTMLKVAEQRNEMSSRTALLVVYQLETLLDCRSPLDARLLRNRIKLILGEFPEAADCINELYGVRDGLLLGSRPVQRPPLITHDNIAEFLEQVDVHNNAVETGSALVLVILRELISRDAQGFDFTERLGFRNFQQV